MVVKKKFMALFIPVMSFIASCAPAQNANEILPVSPLQSSFHLNPEPIVFSGKLITTEGKTFNLSGPPALMSKIKKFVTSCDCVTVISSGAYLPSGSQKICVGFDGSADPDFSGRLVVDIDAVDDQNSVITSFTVHVNRTK